ncbi:hypothetical protein MtrunA17_Chr7g0242101 [Medicago truncatula]|uniref:DUF247 domain protein n=1 Tax=Medicago truncatula TaxID=3880 RepID=G7KRE4_MEDTR|nr:DUF247 domain protein [Medicago truncatula]RHN46429.1 hypothetical protein MtrunA17_Chr7g0242101 [Medicago truncatula]
MMKGWSNSLQTLLQTVDHDYIQSCSIPVVPKELKNSSNEEAYMPRLVSIGPRFRGSREDLLLMEKVKLRSMLSLLHRAGKSGDFETYLDKCSRAIWDLDKQVRSSYAFDVKVDKIELADIMLVDGCFLLELVITKGYDSELPSHMIPPGPFPDVLPSYLNPPVPTPEVLKDEDDLSDLFSHMMPPGPFPDVLPSRLIPPGPAPEVLKDEDVFSGLFSHMMPPGPFPEVLPSRLFPPGPAPEVLKDEDVLSDLLLLENQIPILVLYKLSQILFPDVFDPKDWKKGATKINNIFISILGYSLSEVPIFTAAPHILDSVHFSVNNKMKSERESDAVGNHVVSIIDTTQYPKLKLKRSASRLQAAGVTFIKLAEETGSGMSCFSFLRNCFGGILVKLGNMFVKINKQVDAPAEEVKGLEFYFEFKKGKLEIAQLHITKTTKAKWLNFIALEHHKNNWKRYNISGEQISKSCLSWTFTSSALIFDGLICSAADAKLLKEKNIIVDHLKMSNEELKEFFLNMTFGLDSVGVDSNHVKMVDNLNNYSQAFFFVRILKIFWILFKYRVEWFFDFFETYYNFVAAMLAILTAVQTVYAVMTYHLPK